MKFFFLPLCALILPSLVAAQVSFIDKKELPDSILWRKTNTWFMEVAGYSILSPTYDKIVYVKPYLKLSVRAGFSFFPSNKHNGKNTFAYLFPIGLNAFCGNGKHHFQTGMGELYINTYEYHGSTALETEKTDVLITYLFFGYRYQKPQGGFFLQAGWTPAVVQIKTNAIPYFGISPLIAGIGIGYSFLPKAFRNQIL